MPHRAEKTLPLALLALTASLWAGAAEAQTSPGAQPQNNDFAVDVFQGPVLAPTRVASMGGAYAGYAEGIAGFVANASSPAIRVPWSTAWFDQDIDASISVPLGLGENNDFDNSGDVDADYTNFLYLSLGGLLQFGPAGLGFFGDLQRYTLQFENDPEQTIVTLGRFHLLGGWHFFNNQITFGGGARIATLGVDAPDAELTFLGAAPQVGLLVKPDWTPFRFGATYRHTVKAGGPLGAEGRVDPDGVRRAGQLALPATVALPWEVEMGLAVQVGSRPLTPSGINPLDHEQELREAYAERKQRRLRDMEEAITSLPPGPARAQLAKRLRRREKEIAAHQERQLERDLGRLREELRARAKNWPRERLLLTLDLLVTGPVDDAISLERFLGQGQPLPASTECLVVGSGRGVNFSPRLGLEMEPVKQWVHTRFGTYYEPNRFHYQPDRCNDRVGRQHFTFGGDVKLVTTTWWGLVPEVTYKLQAYGDLAPRYQSFGGGIGVWH